MPLASCNSQPKAKIYCVHHISFLKRYWRCKIKKWYHAKVAHLWHQNVKPWITWREICNLPWVPETFHVSFQFICKSGLYGDPWKSRKVFHALCPLSPKSDQHEISPYNISSLENIVVMRIEHVIREDESNWYFNKFSPLLVLYKDSKWESQFWYQGLKG